MVRSCEYASWSRNRYPLLPSAVAAGDAAAESSPYGANSATGSTIRRGAEIVVPDEAPKSSQEIMHRIQAALQALRLPAAKFGDPTSLLLRCRKSRAKLAGGDARAGAGSTTVRPKPVRKAPRIRPNSAVRAHHTAGRASSISTSRRSERGRVFKKAGMELRRARRLRIISVRRLRHGANSLGDVGPPAFAVASMAGLGGLRPALRLRSYQHEATTAVHHG